MDHQDKILQLLAEKGQLNSLQLEEEFKITYEALYAQLVSLSALNYIELKPQKVNKTLLTKEGQLYAKQGTPEGKIYQMSTAEGVDKAVVEQQLKEQFKIALGNAMKKKIITLKDNKIFKAKDQFVDQDKAKLVFISQGSLDKIQKGEMTELKKRKLIEEKQSTHFLIVKGSQFKEKKTELQVEITSAMIADGSWEKEDFKDFNPNAKGKETDNGNLHPLMKTKQEFIEILIEMGFEEMKTNRYVESSFWNFDALFQPQAHPARDAHDTFFLAKPKQATVHDKQYFQKVKEVHEKGGYGSLGYDCEWEEKEAFKNLLRTHTTAVSSRVLRQMAAEKPFRPRKFFSIDRVFRNQTLDATHLAEFHQVQGFIIDRDLGLNHLIGTLVEFYKKIGIENISLKPTYNPYTQPSMQIYGIHPISKKKIEIGNSGLFRPQMLRPMGFPEDVSVIAWGLSLERPTMIQFGIENIKDLFGPNVSIKKVKDSAIYCI